MIPALGRNDHGMILGIIFMSRGRLYSTWKPTDLKTTSSTTKSSSKYQSDPTSYLISANRDHMNRPVRACNIQTRFLKQTTQAAFVKQ